MPAGRAPSRAPDGKQGRRRRARDLGQRGRVEVARAVEEALRGLEDGVAAARCAAGDELGHGVGHVLLEALRVAHHHLHLLAELFPELGPRVLERVHALLHDGLERRRVLEGLAVEELLDLVADAGHGLEERVVRDRLAEERGVVHDRPHLVALHELVPELAHAREHVAGAAGPEARERVRAAVLQRRRELAELAEVGTVRGLARLVEPDLPDLLLVLVPVPVHPGILRRRARDERRDAEESANLRGRGGRASVRASRSNARRLRRLPRLEPSDGTRLRRRPFVDAAGAPCCNRARRGDLLDQGSLLQLAALFFTRGGCAEDAGSRDGITREVGQRTWRATAQAREAPATFVWHARARALRVRGAASDLDLASRPRPSVGVDRSRAAASTVPVSRAPRAELLA